MDEPLTGLDTPAQESLLNLLDTLQNQNVTVMVATHDLEQAARHFDRILLLNHRIVSFVKTPYGKGVSYRDLDGLTRTVCAALVRKAGRLTGVEFRYLRLHLRLSQKALARLLGNTEQSVANWEKKGRVPLWADKHLRILWQAAQDGHETVKRVVARLNEVERLVNQRIVVEETRRGWRSRVEPATV